MTEYRLPAKYEHSAACYDCAYQSPWVEDKSEADDARIEHEANGPAHKIKVMSRLRRTRVLPPEGTQP